MNLPRVDGEDHGVKVISRCSRRCVSSLLEARVQLANLAEIIEPSSLYIMLTIRMHRWCCTVPYSFSIWTMSTTSIYVSI